MRGRRVLIIVALSLAIVVAGAVAEPSDPVGVSKYGESLTPELELTPIASILSEADAWAGRRVRVAGEVSGVCTRQGCWMDLVSADDATLRVKVEDGVIVFPPEAKGHPAVAEGEVEILEMERGKYESWLRHVADEEGRAFDPAEVGDGPYRIVRLRGIGAEIEGL